MTLMNFLEFLANNTHHKIDIEALLKNQSDEIRQAFLNNNSLILKTQFDDTTEITANRIDIVKVRKY